MKTRMLFLSTIALTLMGSAIVPQIAKADIPMTIGVDEGFWYLSTPSEDTTAPAYGGRLRLYDVHIAKMVEVTHEWCSRGNPMSGEWYYTASSGKTKMGKFRISCKLAQDLVSAYGLGKSERTQLEGTRRVDMIPTLNITGGKVEKWMNFTSNFKPVRF